MLGVSPGRTRASVGTVPAARPSGLPAVSSSRLSGGDSHLTVPSFAFNARYRAEPEPTICVGRLSRPQLVGNTIESWPLSSMSPTAM